LERRAGRRLYRETSANRTWPEVVISFRNDQMNCARLIGSIDVPFDMPVLRHSLNLLRNEAAARLFKGVSRDWIVFVVYVFK
jgi:hypothetical protein